MDKSDSRVLVMYAPTHPVNTDIPLHPISRYLEISRAASEKVRCEKYLVWKLLECAVRERFDLDFANLQFTKTDDGKWKCPDFYFSLSHSDGAVCVAVSDRPVGVDIEGERRIGHDFARRFLTDNEWRTAEGLASTELDGFFLRCWVRKESEFKLVGTGTLSPAAHDTLGSQTPVERVTVRGREYLIAVAAANDVKYEIKYTEEI